MKIVPGGRDGRADAHRPDILGIDPVLHDGDAGQRRKTAPDLAEVGALVECNAVPTVDAGFIVDILPFGVIGDDALEMLRADLIQEVVDRADARTRHGSAAGSRKLCLRRRNGLRHFRREFYGERPFQGKSGSRGPDDPGRGRTGIAAGKVRRLLRTRKRRKQAPDE